MWSPIISHALFSPKCFVEQRASNDIPDRPSFPGHPSTLARDLLTISLPFLHAPLVSVDFDKRTHITYYLGPPMTDRSIPRVRSDENGANDGGSSQSNENDEKPDPSANIAVPQSGLSNGQALLLSLPGLANNNLGGGTQALPLLRQTFHQGLGNTQVPPIDATRVLPTTSADATVTSSSDAVLNSLIQLQMQEQLLVMNQLRPLNNSTASGTVGMSQIEGLLHIQNGGLPGNASAVAPLGSPENQLWMALRQQEYMNRLRMQAGTTDLLTCLLRQQMNAQPEPLMFLPPASAASLLSNISPFSRRAPEVPTPASVAHGMQAQIRNEISPTAVMKKAEPLEEASKAEQEKGKSGAIRRKRQDSESTSTPAAASNSEEPGEKRAKRPYHHESFPVKLHRLLRETEESNQQDIISFSDDGKEFAVHNPSEFERKVLPKYFRHNKLSSFRRLLNMYGFTRLQNGAEGGTFRHPSFAKDQPELCKDLDRVR